MIDKILRLLVYTLKVNDKGYLLNRENLTDKIQQQLSEKQKTLSEFFFFFFFAFLKYILNFKYLPTKDVPRSLCISGNTAPKNMVR